MKITVLDIMQLILITLKLLNKIDLSWGMVFIPLYITLGIILARVLIEVYQDMKKKRAFDRWIKKR
ncbi:hypothetical protein [uncultured Fusobacterium sp.]|uniref:hypothetical protein n=1 Tax=uncultured Fusobacterium sp. TaxID=159267 RepID=UPI0027DE56FC|nr:hypothetical protein [uncultured Fusobacterium sp.]